MLRSHPSLRARGLILVCREPAFFPPAGVAPRAKTAPLRCRSYDPGATLTRNSCGLHSTVRLSLLFAWCPWIRRTLYRRPRGMGPFVRLRQHDRRGLSTTHTSPGMGLITPRWPDAGQSKVIMDDSACGVKRILRYWGWTRAHAIFPMQSRQSGACALSKRQAPQRHTTREGADHPRWEAPMPSGSRHDERD